MPPNKPAAFENITPNNRTGRIRHASIKLFEENIIIISLLKTAIIKLKSKRIEKINLNILLKKTLKSSLPYSSATEIPKAFENAAVITFNTDGNLLATAYMPIDDNPKTLFIIGLFIPSTSHHIIEFGIRGIPYINKLLSFLLLNALKDINLLAPEANKEKAAAMQLAIIIDSMYPEAFSFGISKKANTAIKKVWITPLMLYTAILSMLLVNC